MNCQLFTLWIVAGPSGRFGKMGSNRPRIVVALVAVFVTFTFTLALPAKENPDDIPQNLEAHDVTDRGMVLTWRSPSVLKPKHYKITFYGSKEYLDSQGMTQSQRILPMTITIRQGYTSYALSSLTPFTTYHVKVTAVPEDYSYTPPARLSVTTLMAAPPPIIKPDFYDVANADNVFAILPQASEEYGPVSYYYIIVVPEDRATYNKDPEQFLTTELVRQKDDKNGDKPYIAAKFNRRIPYTFPLGDTKQYGGFENRRLEEGKRYRIFVRAVVETPKKNLHTSSPFSDFLEIPESSPVPAPVPVEEPVPAKKDSRLLWVGGAIVGASILVTGVGIVLLKSR